MRTCVAEVEHFHRGMATRFRLTKHSDAGQSAVVFHTDRYQIEQDNAHLDMSGRRFQGSSNAIMHNMRTGALPLWLIEQTTVPILNTATKRREWRKGRSAERRAASATPHGLIHYHITSITNITIHRHKPHSRMLCMSPRIL